MRMGMTLLLAFLALSITERADAERSRDRDARQRSVSERHALPRYHWCAEYRIRGGATNCYFQTYEQCMATVSGIGGFCRRNLFEN